jgi:hypothetical protein
MNQDIPFLTDSDNSVRGFVGDISPCAEHDLDWLHITMR